GVIGARVARQLALEDHALSDLDLADPLAGAGAVGVDADAELGPLDLRLADDLHAPRRAGPHRAPDRAELKQAAILAVGRVPAVGRLAADAAHDRGTAPALVLELD